MIDISMCVIILNKICLSLLDNLLGNTICAFSRSFSVYERKQPPLKVSIRNETTVPQGN